MAEHLTQTVLNIDPQVFWGLVTLLVFGDIVGLTLTMAKLPDPEENWLAQLTKDQRGRAGKSSD